VEKLNQAFLPIAFGSVPPWNPSQGRSYVEVRSEDRRAERFDAVVLAVHQR